MLLNNISNLLSYPQNNMNNIYRIYYLYTYFSISTRTPSG